MINGSRTVLSSFKTFSPLNSEFHDTMGEIWSDMQYKYSENISRVCYLRIFWWDGSDVLCL